MDAVLIVVAVISGLLLLYTVVRLGVRDGVLDARAKDDAQLAQRSPDEVLRDGKATHSSLNEVDDRAE